MKKKFNYEKYYKDYWLKEFDKRNKDKYYEKLYDPIKKYLIVPKNKKIIDIGGGNGHFLKYMGYKSATVLDVSESGLKFANKLGYSVIKSDVLKRYPVSEESFDVAYCFEVLEHLDKPNKTLCEIHNILREGGILFISIPNFKPDGVHHKRRWKYIELKDDLKKSGFDIVWFKNIPRFNLRYKQVLAVDYNLFGKILMLFGHIVFFKRFRLFLANIFPDLFVAMYIVKCKKN